MSLSCIHRLSMPLPELEAYYRDRREVVDMTGFDAALIGAIGGVVYMKSGQKKKTLGSNTT